MIETFWTFCNSPVGVAIVSGIVLAALGRLFSAKPSWEEIYDTYRADLFSAVRYAEQVIPDNTPNKALARLYVSSPNWRRPSRARRRRT